MNCISKNSASDWMRSFFHSRSPYFSFTRASLVSRGLYSRSRNTAVLPAWMRLNTNPDAQVASHSCHEGTAFYMSMLAVSSSTP